MPPYMPKVMFQKVSLEKIQGLIARYHDFSPCNPSIDKFSAIIEILPSNLTNLYGTHIMILRRDCRVRREWEAEWKKAKEKRSWYYFLTRDC